MALGYVEQFPGHYERDHLIRLELGARLRASATSSPSSGPGTEATRARTPGHKKVCNGTLILRQAHNQELAYKREHG